MWEIWRNNMFGGVALSSYGGFWMGFAIVGTTLPPAARVFQDCYVQQFKLASFAGCLGICCTLCCLLLKTDV